MKNLINIGIPSKGRLRKDVLKIFNKKKLKLISERGERDLIGSIKNKSNIKILYLHAREIIERLGDGSLDIGFSGFDLLKESEINIQNKITVIKKLNFLFTLIFFCVLISLSLNRSNPEKPISKELSPNLSIISLACKYKILIFFLFFIEPIKSLSPLSEIRFNFFFLKIFKTSFLNLPLLGIPMFIILSMISNLSLKQLLLLRLDF